MFCNNFNTPQATTRSISHLLYRGDIMNGSTEKPHLVIIARGEKTSSRLWWKYTEIDEP
jgi:hypothetical protein